ncbi:hypothetical protein HJC23_001844 [Cyclotella cryptica]|uniref:tRNA threonylcarbamoyladenosine biosynthesis protein TsaE n=1 Tax=Cyclotella cryptica TaxID=29204 RepID=A0ABD3Q1A2_9STRA|eukprot:CCRYP_009892-RA/>CCRYP_009892-RA protein AED:0.31 eAED:0.33 QI:0/0/0/1/1/1/2/0/263
MRIVPPTLQPLFFMSAAALRKIHAFTALPATLCQSQRTSLIAPLLPAANRHARHLYHSTTRSLRTSATTRQDALHDACNNVSNNNNTDNSYALTLAIPTPEDMQDIGGLLSINTQRGDILLLDGDLGAGKTCFSRGFIRARTGMEEERVTSPTYLLSNCYLADGGETKIYHLDLYRLSGSGQDLLPLDLNNIFHNCISLIEWPSRLSEKPDHRLDVTLTIEPGAEMDDLETRCRIMKLEPYGDRWMERLKFLESEGYFDDLCC